MSNKREALHDAKMYLLGHSRSLLYPNEALNRILIDIEAALAEPEQEPVAHIYPSTLKKFQESEAVGECYSVAVGCPEERSVPVYTSPQPREWQELSEHDIEAICAKADKALSRDINLSWRKALITLTSAALRAKNGG